MWDLAVHLYVPIFKANGYVVATSLQLHLHTCAASRRGARCTLHSACCTLLRQQETYNRWKDRAWPAVWKGWASHSINDGDVLFFLFQALGVCASLAPQPKHYRRPVRLSFSAPPKDHLHSVIQAGTYQGKYRRAANRRP